MRLASSLATIFGLVLVSETVPAETLVRVAVASNFAAALDTLAEAFEGDGGDRIVTSAASTGKLFAQISNGAPFDVLLAADVQRPERLEATGLAVPGTRFTYAVGRLVVWSRDPGLAAASCRDAVLAATTARIAIANPRTAPYGEAARQALVALGAWETVRSRLVFGENIAQTLQFVATGNATLGFVAAAQMQLPVAGTDGVERVTHIIGEHGRFRARGGVGHAAVAGPAGLRSRRHGCDRGVHPAGRARPLTLPC